MVGQGSSFVYVTYIRTTRERLWEALTAPSFMRRFWFGMAIETDWQAGSPWRLLFEDGRVADSGEIVEAVPHERIVMTWRNAWNAAFHAEGTALCRIEIEAAGEAMKLTIAHTMEQADSGLIGAVSGGWPKILSNLKSLLEVGEVALV